MTNSMTGYGRAQKSEGGRDITVELRSVNHRYFEYSARLPRSLSFLEEAIKTLISARVSRGKLECAVLLRSGECETTRVRPNLALAAQYKEALAELSRELSLPFALDTAELAALPDIFLTERVPVDEQALSDAVLPLVREALENFCAMRAREGERLRADMESHLALVREDLSFIQAAAPALSEQYRERLYAKLSELLGDTAVEPQRLLTEAAIYADRVAVDEETVRLESHLTEFSAILAQPEPVGRKLDFLTQEINREINTIGSKCQNLPITRRVVHMKAEVEKVREQLQNIE